MSGTKQTTLLLAVIALFGERTLLPGQERCTEAATTLAEQKRVLRETTDPKLLEETALKLSHSPDPAALRALTAALLNPQLWRRLDSDHQYRVYRGYHVSPLRINRILRAIGQAGTPIAEGVLLRLAEDRPFTSHEARLDGLTEASGWIRQPSTRLIEFLNQERCWQSEGRLVVRALARLGTVQACAVIESRIFSPDYSEEDKIGWFTDVLIYQRNRLNIVELYKRVLSKGLQGMELRHGALQSLFHFRLKVQRWHHEPEPWYGGGRNHPLPRDASVDVLRELLTIADLAVRMDIPEQTQRGIRQARQEIESLLQRKKLDHSPRRLAELIANLGDDRFAVREKATKELAKLGDLAETALHRKLKENSDPEVRRRLNYLLKLIH